MPIYKETMMEGRIDYRYNVLHTRILGLHPNDTACLLDYLLHLYRHDTVLMGAAERWLTEQQPMGKPLTPAELEEITKLVEQGALEPSSAK
jgi:hypothetical protein